LSMSEPTVIVGAGQCGARAAMALREIGWAGPIALIGEEPEAPYDRPPLSKKAITAAETPAPATICDIAQLAEAGIDFLGGVRATGIDREAHEVILADGRRIRYARLLIATGARARRLLIPGGDRVLYLRRFSDALVLRDRVRPGARIGIIGGGFIGSELAASLSARDCAVSVVELSAHLMGRVVPPRIADLVAARHEGAGVTLIFGAGVVRIEQAGEGSRIVLDGRADIDCDVVVAAVGAVPETTLAEAATLEIENGVKVDGRLTTSDPDIFAAGDCCSFPHPIYGDRRIRLEAWRNALDQGNAAARNIAGANETYDAVPSFWSDQYDLTIRIAGLPDAGQTEVVRPRDDGVDLRFGLGADGTLAAASGFGQGDAVAKDIRLAEMLIARRATPDPDLLANPAVSLKAMLSSMSR
jgi:3-phenylpropionate/trans-cinnamate dioxygenase ferredoxin reductase subunit